MSIGDTVHFRQQTLGGPKCIAAMVCDINKPESDKGEPSLNLFLYKSTPHFQNFVPADNSKAPKADTWHDKHEWNK